MKSTTPRAGARHRAPPATPLASLLATGFFTLTAIFGLSSLFAFIAIYTLSALFALLVFSGTALAAETTPSNTTEAALQAAVNTAGIGGTVTYTGPGTTFGNGTAAIRITSSNQTIRGTQASNYASGVSGLNASILSQVQAGKSGTASDLSNLAGGLANSFITSAISAASMLSHIQATTAGVRTAGSPNSLYNENKWLAIASTNATGLRLENLHFNAVNVEYSNTRIVNGLIGNINTTDAATSMRAVQGNAFTGLTVTLKGKNDGQYLAGGGILGLRSVTSSASISDVSGNFFSGLTVRTTNDGGSGSAYLEGGGIIGVDAVSSPAAFSGKAEIGTFTNNLFTGIDVFSGDILLGGGVLGLNNNSREQDPDPLFNGQTLTHLRLAAGNVFGNGANDSIKVETVFSIRGGGVIGLNSLSNAGVRLDALRGNVFNGIKITTGSYIKGGGVVGLHGNNSYDGLATKDQPGDDSYNENGSSNSIDDDKFNLAAITALDNPMVILAETSGNVFLNTTVETTTYISGGGIVGVRAGAGAAILEDMYGNIFKGLRVTTTGLTGGGIVGVSSSVYASLGAGFTGIRNNYFDDLFVTTRGALDGGGILGVQASDNSGKTPPLAGFGDVVENTFTNLRVTTENGGSIRGGGIIGAFTNNMGSNGISSIQGNRFDNLTVTSDANISGGGIVGAYNDTSGVAGITSLANNSFTNLTVTTVGRIEGGGIVGTRSNQYAGIVSIAGNEFRNLRVTAGTYFDGGGIIGVTGGMANNPITGIGEISDTVFSSNQVEALDGQVMGGLIYSYGLTGGLVITNSQFVNNDFYSAVSSAYGGAPYDGYVYGTITVDTGSTGSGDNVLTLRATAGRNTVFSGNTIHDEDTVAPVRTNSLYFGIVSDVDPTTNVVSTDPAEADATLNIAAETGGTVALYDPIQVEQNNGKTFNMNVLGSGGDFLWGGTNQVAVPTGFGGVFNLESGSRTTLLQGFRLDAQEHNFELLSGGRLNVMGSDSMRVTQANLYGRMHFHLDGTTVDDPTTVMLKIESPSNSQNVDISGSTVTLNNFAAGPKLNPGDEFYLIETDDDDYLQGDPSNNRATALQGLTTKYEFIIDKNPTNAAVLPSSSKWLVARLARVGAAPETKALLDGRSASLTFLGQWPNWLADHSYQSADLAYPKHDGERGEGPAGEEGWRLAPIAGVDGTKVRIDTGGQVDLHGTTSLIGLSARHRGENAINRLALFAEEGNAHYKSRRTFHNLPDIRGKGRIRYLGAGLMYRYERTNGLRLEGSLRGGHVSSRYHTHDLVNVNGTAGGYKVRDDYLAVHVGAAYTFDLDEEKKNAIDVLARYYWTRLGGDKTHLTSGEAMDFHATQSQRLRLGGRFTHKRDELLSWYGGAAYEYEFDGRAKSKGSGYEFESSGIRGGTLIGDIGIIRRPAPDSHASVELGIQGYVGKVRGYSGGIRVGWTF